MKKCLLLVAWLVMFSLVSVAQNRTITGTVTDKLDGQPIPGVTVQVKGTNLGSQTNQDGKYSVSVPNDAKTLAFQYVGYITREITLGTSNVINVAMEQDSKQLGEVVVTALGISREKKALGYAVTDLKGDNLKQSGEVNVIESLAAKAAGVQVTSAAGVPGASSKIQLRGVSTFTSETQPLIVVDGVPIDNSTTTTVAGDYPFNQTLSGVNNANRAIDINPDDIESVTILKGPAAAALYGARAGNGAIVYTTKRGKKGSGLGITLSQTFDYSEVNRLPNLQSKYAQGVGGNYITADPGPDNIYNTDDDVSGGTSSSWGPAIASTPDLISYNNTDNYFEKPWTSTTDLSIDGGNDKVTFRFSAGRTDQSGIVPNTDFKRNSLRITADGFLKDWLKVGGTANYIRTTGIQSQNGSNIGGVMLGLLRAPASFDIRDYKFSNNFQRTYFALYDNPFYTAYENPFNTSVNRIIGNVYLSYTGKPWFNAMYKIGVDSYSDDRRQVYAVSSFGNDAGDQTGQVNYNTITNRDIYSDLIFTGGGPLIGDIKLNYTAGFNISTSNFGSLYSRGQTLSVPGFYDMSNAATKYSSTSAVRKYTNALFGQLDFAFRDMLFLTLTGRNEWSSTFGESKNNFFYPSASLAWLFSETFNLTDWISFGKFRYSYSQAGISPEPYNTKTYYKPPIYTDGFTNGLSFPYGSANGFGYDGLTVLGNSNLQPEKVTANELGLDLKMFQSRLSLGFTYYHQTTNDILLNRPLSASSGFTAEYVNSGKAENQGYEVEVAGDVVKSQNFNWNLGVTWSTNKNKVLELAEGVTQLQLESAFTDIGSYAIIGEPIGVFYGTKWQRNTNGDLIIGANGVPLKQAESGNIGNPQPDWMGGIRNTFTFKGIGLNVLFDIRHGGAIWNGTYARLNRLGRTEQSADRERTYVIPGVLEDGTTPNTTEISALTYFSQYLGDGGGAAEQFVEDVNWFRVREVSLSYTFRLKKMEKFIHSLSVRATGRNLFLDTNYKGGDPETSLTGAGSNLNGFDYFNNPGARSFIFGLTVGF
ncbi:SusC/RagA family TonB-linked outer membrane protein [Solitalea sp. MAHUQ-68]|uniref:SusC/RagA family TonB-linked outer membrane protein n=1 Tax=Solitalea agri TaxID=2953739 RepID=A0A9X2FAG0_9SPHI|nr:SusC/RagA family TonB-linked outer membrane protein [Solitalea agri]MCO4293338.1 SusC/RagA family TonB-linked outer membrane protein [Solitalea agri]